MYSVVECIVHYTVEYSVKYCTMYRVIDYAVYAVYSVI